MPGLALVIAGAWLSRWQAGFDRRSVGRISMGASDGWPIGNRAIGGPAGRNLGYLEIRRS
jgi:hypothetical protein